MLLVSIKHNEIYNKRLPERLQERIVTLSNSIASTKIDNATRTKFQTSCLLLKAMHDDIVSHPTNIEIFGVPVTKALYGRFIALAFSLSFSILFRVLAAHMEDEDEEEL